MKLTASTCALLVATQALGHYTFPSLIINGVTLPAWQSVRRTNNWEDRNPVTDVNNINLRCYTSQTNAKASTALVNAGSKIGFALNQSIYHKGVMNVYMAKVPQGTTAADWDGAGNVWFKVHEIGPITNGGSSISFPTDDMLRFEFDLPRALPSGQYLIRAEHIALQEAAQVNGAQFYLGCGQIEIAGGGNGNPGPLVAIPGVYDARDTSIHIDIYWPVPATYRNPGPAVWRG
ncbi:glycoside hydrolase family 61 protein [Pterulicium gracile]|uniref:lytic cellulose monooxygenase (C4-dehydrogenating) n=1 Tax=Pterulicium gracile TaxID=1884261 RepID=A0A5C3QJ13_9AGAR|nr:glycoside hydrolase family 61 protein [Pterula gracilis]